MLINIIDVSGFIYRGFYAIPHLTFENQDVGAVYGFCSSMSSIIKQFPNSMFIAALDSGKKTFRNEIYPEYKANRAKMPEELLSQIPLIKEACEKFGFLLAAFPNFEADDVIASYVYFLKDVPNCDINIISSDKDLMQLLQFSNVKIFDPMKHKYTTEEDVAKKFGVGSKNVLDVLSLMGDSSDNVPGVPGIGPKTAALLINKFGSLDNLLENLSELPASKKFSVLKEEKDKAILSKQLVSLKTDLPVQFEYKENIPNSINEFFLRFGFRSLVQNKFLEEKCNIKQNIDGVPERCFVFNQDDEFEIFWKDSEAGNVFKTKTLENLRDILENQNIEKVCLCSKDLSKRCLSKGIKIQNTIDVSVMSYCVFGTTIKHDIKSMEESYLAQLSSFHSSNLEKIYNFLLPKINSEFLKLFFEIENKLPIVLAQMELEGIKIDKPYLNRLAIDFQEKINNLTAEIQKIAGYKVNIASPKQLSFLLYEKLNLPKQTSKASTDSETLSNFTGLCEGIADKIISWREYSKLLNTYILPLLNLADENSRVHTNYSQTTVNTGRLSSSEPNLQNIPNRSSEGLKIRKAFIAEEGWKLVSFDYSQVELRILAHLSKSKKLIESFQNGEDIHTSTAAHIFRIPQSEITKAQRSIAKEINFSIIYGISIFQLSKRLNIERVEAQKIFDDFMALYPEILDFNQKCEEFAKANGFVKTLFGRKCFVPLINSKNKNQMNFAKRQASNAPIQGTNADITKIAMLQISDFIKQNGISAKLLLQIHDELVFEVPEGEMSCLEEIKKIMENVVQLDVPLAVDLKQSNHL